MLGIFGYVFDFKGSVSAVYIKKFLFAFSSGYGFKYVRSSFMWVPPFL